MSEAMERYSAERQAEARRRVTIEKADRKTYGSGHAAERSRRRVLIDGQAVAWLSLPNGWRSSWRLENIRGKQLERVAGGYVSISFHAGEFSDFTYVDLLAWRVAGHLHSLEEIAGAEAAEAASIAEATAERRANLVALKEKRQAWLATLGKLLAGEAVDEAERRAALEEAIKNFAEEIASAERVIANIDAGKWR